METFFNFPEIVAEYLTKLTVYHDKLPQGSMTASAISSLAFWDIEKNLYLMLVSKGFRYSRFVDDITISTVAYCNNKNLTYIRSQCYGMFAKKGLKPNRSKERSNSSNQPLIITGICINKKIGLPKKRKADIRAAIKKCEIIDSVLSKAEAIELHNQTLGKIHYLKRLHPKKADKLLVRLKNSKLHDLVPNI